MLLYLPKGEIVFINPYELHTGQSGENGAQYYCIIVETGFLSSMNIDACDKKHHQPTKYQTENFQSDYRSQSVFSPVKSCRGSTNTKYGYELFIRSYLMLLSVTQSGVVN